MSLSCFADLSFPEMYEQELVGPLFRPFAEVLLDEAQIEKGERVLDVACGTGIVARLVKARTGHAARIVGVDVNPAMLAVARRVDADIDWREGDAMRLPLTAQEHFNVVLCQQGLQFFPDRNAATKEMRRALSPGGRLLVSTWRPDEEMSFLQGLRRIAERQLGPIADRRHSFGEAGALEALLRDAGLRNVQSKIVSRTIHFADGAVFVHMNAMALVGMSTASKEMDNAQRAETTAAIVADSAEWLQSQSNAAGLRFELRTNVAIGWN